MLIVITVLCLYFLCSVVRVFFVFFFFKQKTAYEMRISDWSSDVCSSDLWHRTADGCQANRPKGRGRRSQWRNRAASMQRPASSKIGRASCRERVCQYV